MRDRALQDRGATVRPVGDKRSAETWRLMGASMQELNSARILWERAARLALQGVNAGPDLPQMRESREVSRDFVCWCWSGLALAHYN